MKIVVFGPSRRVGVLAGENIVDIEYASAKLAREVENEHLPYAVAAARTPSNLEEFITLGERALEAAQKALEYVTTRAGDQVGPRGEQLLVPFPSAGVHAPLAHRGVKIAMAGANYADHSWI